MNLPMVNECRVIDLQKIVTPGGHLTPVQDGIIPFNIKRIYYLYDVPGGETRGGHAHYDLCQILIAAMGSFDVEVDDGESKCTINLNRAYNGLYIPRMIWRELKNFSSGGICLVIASEEYCEKDYIRDYGCFKDVREMQKRNVTDP